MSLHIYNEDISDTLSLHLPIDDELEWIEQNLNLINSLKSNSDFYHLSHKLMMENESPNTYYFIQNKNADFIGF